MEYCINNNGALLIIIVKGFKELAEIPVLKFCLEIIFLEVTVGLGLPGTGECRSLV